ncbi:hypothetical protein L6452_35692 [Arctium lappa]|uniref:Uncharacterized protein n=1 Tax=Arctium lappa TaxID=4217 RepID=A0ACB8Y759_ARCLA|nr:hypothetical protein L6452_35692 [Arctium lappa]
MHVCYSPQLGSVNKNSSAFGDSGAYTSPGTPHYGDNDVSGFQKGWYSERVLLPSNSSRRHISTATLMPFNSARTLPSKWMMLRDGLRAQFNMIKFFGPRVYRDVFGQREEFPNYEFLPYQLSRGFEGSRFGFARFLGIDDAKKMERDHGNIWVGSYHVRINISKYSRVEKNRVNKTDVVHEKNGKENVSNQIMKENTSNQTRVLGCRSFAEVVNGGSGQVENSPINIISTASSKKRMEKALIAEVDNFSLLQNIGSFSDAEGCTEVKIKYLGGLFVMLDFPVTSGSRVKAMLEKRTSPWKNWFRRVFPWKPKFKVVERIAFLTIHGIPPHARNPLVFMEIDKQWGKVIEVQG